MTAPDPRLGEIEGRANNPFSPENTRAQMDEDRDYLLAELRKAQDALGMVEGFMADPEHYDTQGPSNGYVSVDNIRAAVAAATGGGE